MGNVERYNNYRILSILLVCFVLSRLPLLLTDPAVTEVMEEKVCGVLANDLLSSRPLWALFDYQFFPHAGGTLVISFVVIPFFYLFGQSVVSLKMVPLCFSLATLALWYLFLQRFVNKRVAVLAGIFFICSPSYYTKLNLTAALGHLEENFFSIAIIYLFFVLLALCKPGSKESRRFIVAGVFGLISGFALYCFNQVIITLLACLLFWYLAEKRFIVTRQFGAFLIFFLAGFTPWFAYNLTHHFQGPKFLTLSGSMTPFLTGSHYVDLVKKFFRLVLYNFPHSIIHDCEDNSVIIGGWLAYCLIFFLSYSFLLIRWRVGLKALFLSAFSFRKNAGEYRQYLALFFVLVFPLIYFIVYTVSKFDPVPVDITSVGIFNLLEPPFKIYRYRLFLQIYPFVFVIIAMGIEYLLAHYTNKVLRAGAWLMVIFITLLALVTTIRMVNWDSFGKGFIYKGYDRDFYSFTIIRHSTDLHKTAKTLLLFDKTQQPKAFRMLGLKCAETMPGDVDGLLNLAKDIPATRRKDFLFGYADYVVLKSLPRPEDALTFFKKIPEAYQPYCFEAYGFRLCYKFFSQGMDLSRIIPSLNYLERHFLYKNLVSLHQESPWDAEGYRNALKAVEKVYLPWCYTGLGRFLGNEKDNQQQFKKILEMIEVHYKQYVYSGFITETARLFLRQQEKLFNPDTIGERSRIFYFSEMKTMIEHLLNAVHQIDSTALVYSYERLGMELRDYLNDRQVRDYFIEKVAKKYHIPLLSGLQQS